MGSKIIASYVVRNNNYTNSLLHVVDKNCNDLASHSVVLIVLIVCTCVTILCTMQPIAIL